MTVVEARPEDERSRRKREDFSKRACLNCKHPKHVHPFGQACRLKKRDGNGHNVICNCEEYRWEKPERFR